MKIKQKINSKLTYFGKQFYYKLFL